METVIDLTAPTATFMIGGIANTAMKFIVSIATTNAWIDVVVRAVKELTATMGSALIITRKE